MLAFIALLSPLAAAEPAWAEKTSGDLRLSLPAAWTADAKPPAGCEAAWRDGNLAVTVARSPADRPVQALDAFLDDREIGCRAALKRLAGLAISISDQEVVRAGRTWRELRYLLAFGGKSFEQRAWCTVVGNRGVVVILHAPAPAEAHAPILDRIASSLTIVTGTKP